MAIEPQAPCPECAKVGELLSDYLDGELPEHGRWVVELHLGSCTACTQFLAELAATVTALHRLSRPEAVTRALRGTSSARS